MITEYDVAKALTLCEGQKTYVGKEVVHCARTGDNELTLHLKTDHEYVIFNVKLDVQKTRHQRRVHEWRDI